MTLLFVGAGIYLLGQEGVSVSALAAVARRADPLWLAVAVAFAAVCHPGYALLYQTMAGLRGGLGAVTATCGPCRWRSSWPGSW